MPEPGTEHGLRRHDEYAEATCINPGINLRASEHNSEEGAVPEHEANLRASGLCADQTL